MKTLMVSSGLSRGKSPKTFLEFLKEYDKARSEGWELPEQESVRDFPRFLNEFCIVLHKNGSEEEVTQNQPEPEEVVVEEVKPEPTEEDKLNYLREQVLDPKSRIAKDDLLWLAEKIEVTIPEEMNKPLQIKKFIKEYISENS